MLSLKASGGLPRWIRLSGCFGSISAAIAIWAHPSPDLFDVSPKVLVYSAYLVRNAEYFSFRCFRHMQSEWEHVVADHVFFSFGNREISLRVFQRFCRMCHAVQSVTFIRGMPVLEEVIMKQSAPNQSSAIDLRRKKLGKRKAHHRHSAGMIIYADARMVDNSLFILHTGGV